MDREVASRVFWEREETICKHSLPKDACMHGSNDDDFFNNKPVELENKLYRK